MALPTQPLHDEHQQLFPHIENLREVADSIGQAPTAEIQRELEAAYDFLAHHLLVHAQAEDRVLYPVVAQAIGAPQATDTMRRDHVEIGKLIEELGSLRRSSGAQELSEGHARALRRVLYGLYTLVKVHFLKEEDVYLPILDEKMSAAEVNAMYARMETAAEAVRRELT